MSKVTGYRQTAAAIRKLARFPRAKVGAASQKALRPMLAKAKANLRANKSYKRGVLFRSMRIRKLRSSSALSQWVIAATGRGVGIAHLVEAGTAPHWQPKRGVMHPGAKAKPFLEPAYFDHDDQVIQIMTKELGTDLISYANQIAYRGR
jgi:HK97 gp10 family phage protein